MKKLTLGLLLLFAITAFGFVSSQTQTPNSSKEELTPITGIDKSGYTESNEDSW